MARPMAMKNIVIRSIVSSGKLARTHMTDIKKLAIVCEPLGLISILDL
jgi:hypothetical protein